MGLNIKNPETHELVKELSKLTGESMTTAITRAVEERLARLQARREADIKAKVQEIMELVRKSGGSGGAHSSDHNNLYGEDGLPK